MTPFDEHILQTMELMCGRRQQRVRSLMLAIELNTSQRAMQRYLSRLEAQGMVARPFGAKSGYAVAYPARNYAVA